MRESKSFFGQTLDHITAAVSSLLPLLTAFVVILVIALVLAVLARVITRRLLSGLDFDRRMRQWSGITTEEPSPGRLPTKTFNNHEVQYWKTRNGTNFCQAITT